MPEERKSRTSPFIGRAHEIELFQSWFTNPDSPWLLYVHDAEEEPEKKGGVGKTWLLRKYAELARQYQPETAVVMIDFFGAGDRDRIFLAQRIVDALERLYPVWQASLFTQTLALYRGQAKSPSGETEGIEDKYREELGGALVEDFQRLNTYLADQEKTLLVLFDTFEVLEQNPGLAVLRRGQTFPDTYQFSHMRAIIAGRNHIDWSAPNWAGRAAEVQVLPLAPFSQLEMQLYVQSEAIDEITSDKERLHGLYQRTGGRPILIGLAIDVLNHHILSFDQLVTVSQREFESYLVPQVNKLEDPLNWVILFMAHVYHRFNIPLLERILKTVRVDRPTQEAISREALPENLIELSFVRHAGDDFVLHDEMRRLVIRYCWEKQDVDRRYRKDISRSVIDYYEEEIAGTRNDQLRQRNMLEIVYHRLFIDPQDGMDYFQQRLEDALPLLKTAFSRLLLQEAHSLDTYLSLEQRNDLLLAEVRVLRYENDFASALTLLEQIDRYADTPWYREREVKILHEAGMCYRLQGHLHEATTVFTRCLDIVQERQDEQQQAFYLTMLGLLALLRGEFSLALDFYEKSMVISRRIRRQIDYATNLMNTAGVYRRLGKLDEALRRGKIAWQLRLSLFHAGQLSEIVIGNTLHVLGLIYLDSGNILEAEDYFNRAFEIYQRLNDTASIAMVYNRFGSIQMAKGEIDGALAWFEKAEESSRNLDPAQYISSLNRQGRVYLQQQQWIEAQRFFERAIAVARPIPDNFQVTESLIDLAVATEHMGQEELALRWLDEAEVIADKESYSGLLGRIAQQRAEICYAQKEYHQAFQHFLRYCQHSLNYNYASFSQAVQKVVDALLGIPQQMVPSIVEEVRKYWTEQHLEQSYPELILACEEVDGFMIQ